MRQLPLALLLACFATAASAELKMVVADPVAAISASEQAKKANADFDREVSGQVAEGKKLEAELQACDQKIKRDGATMSATDLAKFKGECEIKYNSYRALGQQLQKMRTEREQAMLKDMYPKYQQALDALIKEGGYDLILQREAVIYSAPVMDVTAKITAKLNSLK